MDLQQRSWLLEVRTVPVGSVDDVDKRLVISSSQFAISRSARAKKRSGPGDAGPDDRLPLRLAADQLLDLRLLRSAGIVAGLQRLFRFALLARSPFGFLAFVAGQLGCIGHDSF